MVLYFAAYKAEGNTVVITVHLSSGLIGAYHTPFQAASRVEGMNVHPVESKTACLVEGSLVIIAIDLIKDGKNIDAILEDLEDMRQHTGAYLGVDDLKNLSKSGRITGAHVWIGNLLKIKTGLTFDGG
ncbi:DegV family protein [Staphylococcus hyicus]